MVAFAVLASIALMIEAVTNGVTTVLTLLLLVGGAAGVLAARNPTATAGLVWRVFW